MDRALVFGTSDGGSIPSKGTVKGAKLNTMTWYVYMVQAQDGSLYTGITKDIKRRIQEHNTDDVKGAKSLRAKRPVVLVYQETYDGQSEACKRETAIKKWKREAKLNLIRTGL